MTFDIPTLSVAVLLVMFLSSLSLIAHWLANRATGGLGAVASGVLAFSLGNCFLFEYGAELALEGKLYNLLGQTLVLLGLLWVWLGIAEFWQIKQRRLVFFASLLVALAVVSLAYQTFGDGSSDERRISEALFASAVSLGVIFTLMRALGGRFGFYKGIIRRTTLGVGLTAVLFGGHALYGLYFAFMLAAGHQPLFGSLMAISQLEILAFVMLLALVIIIMTAERLQAELKIQEMMDPLTRALNRRAFMEVMKAVLARARRLAEPVSVVMVDIDKFKKVNLAHGRSVGDLALAEFSELVTDGRRSQDVFCRFGGEEFVLMLPGTAEEGADLVAARIKQRIETASITPNAIPIKLTISMGVVTARGDDLEVDGMLDMVDRRMHKAQKLQFQVIETAD